MICKLTIMKILVAEDDPEIGAALRQGLEQAGYIVHVSRDGSRIVNLVKKVPFSLLILDVMLPGLNGFEVCRQLRTARINVPVLMLTARDTLDDRVNGLDAGADDYLVKPFQFPELLARIRSLQRRDKSVKSTIIRIDDLVIDTARRTVLRGERSVQLTQREFSLLEALALNEGNVLSKETIVERVWFEDQSQSNTVEVHVKNLRKKIDFEEKTKLIQTVYGLGYSLRVDP